MAWKEASIMDLRKEFVSLANQADANIRELCHRFQISPTTGYKWLERYRKDSREFSRPFAASPSLPAAL